MIDDEIQPLLDLCALHPAPVLALATQDVFLDRRAMLRSGRMRRSDGTMLWILVLAPWVALLSLILHDATKDDREGSAISIVTRDLGAFIDWAMLKARMLRSARSHAISQTDLQSPAVPPPKKKRWRKDGRVSITIPELELTMVQAVQKTAPDCEGFVGVIVQRTKPASRSDVNWEIQGIKFGNADRKIASEALTTITERLQREFLLIEN